MKTKYFKFLSVFVAVIIAFSVFSFSVSAATPYCSFPWEQPPADSSSCGYIEIMCEHNGEKCAIVYSYRVVIPFFDGEYPYVPVNGEVTITSSSSFRVTFTNYNPYPSDIIWTYYRYNPSSYYGLSYESNVIYLQADYFFNSVPWIPSGWEIKKVRAYGILYPADYSSNTPYFSGKEVDGYGPILYGNDTIINDNINFLISILQQKNNNDVVGAINNSTNSINKNQNENTDKILNAGSDVSQPDFAGTNGQLDSTTAQMDAIEGQYKIDQQSTTAELSKGTSFINGYELNLASIQVKEWIERFASENTVISSFLVAALCLGLCFWVIGRKAASG